MHWLIFFYVVCTGILTNVYGNDKQRQGECETEHNRRRKKERKHRKHAHHHHVVHSV